MGISENAVHRPLKEQFLLKEIPEQSTIVLKPLLFKKRCLILVMNNLQKLNFFFESETFVFSRMIKIKATIKSYESEVYVVNEKKT